MIYIIEGMDNCLKDTIIYELRSILPPETQVLKFSNPPKGVDPRNYQEKHFRDMFDMLTASLAEGKRHLILNRSHLGEYVYAPIYRNYEAEWIFEMEQDFLNSQDVHLKVSFLFLLYDTNNEKLKYREDGKSLSKQDDEKMNNERGRFLHAFIKSGFKHKLKFNLSEYTNPHMSPKNEVNVCKIITEMATLARIK